MFCIGINVLPSRPRLEKVEKGLEIEREMAKAMDHKRIRGVFVTFVRKKDPRSDVCYILPSDDKVNRNHIRIFVVWLMS